MAEPIPPPSIDPTLLTTEALRREIALLDASITRRMASLEAELDSRLGSTEKLVNEKFASVDKQFEMLGVLREQGHEATETAVSAALQAQKEAVAKSEASTAKQLEQLTVTFEARVESLRRSIDENKDRLASEARELRAAIGLVDSKANSYAQQRRGADASRSLTFALIAAIVGVTGVILAIVAFAAH